MGGTYPAPTFLEDLARARPDPGGGAAAAYVALLGLALLAKVSRLESGRCPAGDDRCAFWREQLDGVQRLQTDFSRLCQDDIRAYQRLTRAPAGGSQAEHRKAAVLVAIACPQEMMTAVQLGLQTTLDIGLHCRQHLVGDVLVAVELLGGALRGAYHIAAANLPLLKTTDERQTLADQLERDLNASLDRLAALREELTARLGAVAAARVPFDSCC